jgi:hypothetical protein
LDWVNKKNHIIDGIDYKGFAHKLGTGRYYCVPELKVVDGSVGGILAKPGQF